MLIQEKNRLIKGSITVIYEPPVLSWFGYNSIFDLFTENTPEIQLPVKNAIVLFDIEQDIFDLMENKIDFVENKDYVLCSNNIKCEKSYNKPCPLYFKNEKNTYFNYNEDIEKEKKYMDELNLVYFDDIKSEIENSTYNCTYHKINYRCDTVNNVLIIRKIKHGTKSHRYLFYYDKNEFTKEELKTILYYTFCLQK